MKKYFLISILFIYSGLYCQNPGDFYKRASEKYKNKDYFGAIIEYTRAINLDSTSAVLFNNRGICKFKVEKYSEALEDYSYAQKLNPDLPNVYLNMGNCYTELFDYARALISFDHCINLKPDYRAAFIKRANVRYFLEDYSGARVDYNTAINLTQGKSQKLYLLRGNTAYMMKQYDSAMADYNRALELEPGLYAGYVNRGICKLEMDDPEGAIRDFTLSIRYNGLNGESYYYRAMANVHKMKKYHNKFNEDKSALAEYQLCNQLACSDLNKAKEFNYGKAFEACAQYCPD